MESRWSEKDFNLAYIETHQLIQFVFQLETVLSSRGMHYDPRARRLRGKGRINGDSGSAARRDAGSPSHRAILEEEQLGTIGLSRSTGWSGDAGRRYGALVAGRVETGI